MMRDRGQTILIVFILLAVLAGLITILAARFYIQLEYGVVMSSITAPQTPLFPTAPPLPTLGPFPTFAPFPTFNP